MLSGGGGRESRSGAVGSAALRASSRPGGESESGKPTRIATRGKAILGLWMGTEAATGCPGREQAGNPLLTTFHGANAGAGATRAWACAGAGAGAHAGASEDVQGLWV